MKTLRYKEFFVSNILPPLSGIALAAPFLFYSAGWLSLICMLPFLYWLHLQNQYKLNKNFISSTWAIGVVFFFVVVGWIISTRPDNWAYVEGWQGGIGLLIIYLILVVFLSTQFFVIGYCYKRLKINLLSPITFIILPAVWAVSEVFRSYFFSIIAYGPNGSIGPYWNFGVMGFGAVVTPLGFVSRLVGLYGLSFVVVVINLALFWLLHKRFKLPLIIFALIVLLSAISFGIYAKANGKYLNVGAVQLPPTSDNSLTVQYQTKLKKIMEENATAKNSIEMLLLPEYSEFFINDDGSAKEVTNQFLNSNGGVVTSISGEAKEEAKSPNVLVVYSQDGSIKTSHEKQFLIPVGEYMPYIVATLMRITGQGQALKISEFSQTIKRDNQVEPTVLVANRSVGALACSAAIAPELYRSMTRQGAEIITNSASLGTFTNAALYHAQTRQMARFDAIANARPFVQASTGAYSYYIDHNGKFIYRTTHKELNFKQIPVLTNTKKTIYTIAGEWVVLFSFTLIITLLVRSYIHK